MTKKINENKLNLYSLIVRMELEFNFERYLNVYYNNN